QGYWTYELFEQQVIDLLSCLEVLYPDCQIVFEIDYSANHGKWAEDALNVNNMNVFHGGKQTKLRDTVVTAGCLGTFPTKVSLKAGDTQHMTYQAGDPPPFYAPHLGIIEICGQAKGMKQVLFERGLWDPQNQMDGKVMKEVLGGCSDFAGEKSRIRKLLESKGHILLMSPKFHPELAGVGIEFTWGMAKQFYRSNYETASFKTLKQLVPTVLTPEVLPIERIRRFARRTRDYKRMYKE
ncbi:unnamed protein product, partial [Chrysoparadoxa australica]